MGWQTSDTQLAMQKLCKTIHPDHGGRCCPMAAMAPRSRRWAITKLANILCDKSVPLNLEYIFIINIFDFCQKALPHYLLIFLYRHREMYYNFVHLLRFYFLAWQFWLTCAFLFFVSCISSCNTVQLRLRSNFSCSFTPIRLCFNLHTRPLFKIAFIFNTCMSQPNFLFWAVIFYEISAEKRSPTTF